MLKMQFVLVRNMMKIGWKWHGENLRRVDEKPTRNGNRSSTPKSKRVKIYKLTPDSSGKRRIVGKRKLSKLHDIKS